VAISLGASIYQRGGGRSSSYSYDDHLPSWHLEEGKRGIEHPVNLAFCETEDRFNFVPLIYTVLTQHKAGFFSAGVPGSGPAGPQPSLQAAGHLHHHWPRNWRHLGHTQSGSGKSVLFLSTRGAYNVPYSCLLISNKFCNGGERPEQGEQVFLCTCSSTPLRMGPETSLVGSCA
jgi:hypothetical protein